MDDLWRKVNRVAEADNLVSEKDGLPLRQSVFKKRKALIISNEKSCRERGRLVYLSVVRHPIWTQTATSGRYFKEPDRPHFAKAKEVQAITQTDTIAPHLLLPHAP